MKLFGMMKMIKTVMEGEGAIKLFVASSLDEFKAERNELEYFFSQLNNILVKRGMFVKLILCEGSSDAMVDGRMQDAYNDEIRSCDILYVLFRERAGSCTIEEFEVAHQNMFEAGRPQIFVMIQRLGRDDELSEALCSFLGRLKDEFEHPYSFFTHIDQVKYDMLCNVAKSLPLDIELKVEESGIFVCGSRLAGIDAQNGAQAVF